MKRSTDEPPRVLLATMTGEPFQPVRLYYSIASRARLLSAFRRLECVVEAPSERCWHWLYHAEAAALAIGKGYGSVPEASRPVVLAWIRFPKSGGMTVQTTSYARATEAAKFFGPRLGNLVVAVRCRLINRFFASDDGAPDALVRQLDQNVTVIDPRVSEAALERDLAGVRSREEAERAAARSLERLIASGDDVPLVEDFPLAPEEEAPTFQHFDTTLGIRFVRAMEHWRGNTHLTLPALIVRLMEDGGQRSWRGVVS